MLRSGTLSALLAAGLLFPVTTLSAHHGHHQDDGPLSPYAVADQIDLTHLLAPAPLPGSAQTKMELEELLRLQEHRTDAQAAAAVADHIYDVYRFADVLGPKFRPENLPLTTAFFSRVVDTGKSVVEPAKDFWNRQRPGELDSRIRPVMKEPKSASYPSGHATAGTLMAIVLSNMIPEKSAELFARSWNFAQNRVVAGAHFPSDIQAGRITGTLVASSLFQDKAFQGDLAAARIELRQALGYPTNPEP